MEMGFPARKTIGCLTGAGKTGAAILPAYRAMVLSPGARQIHCLIAPDGMQFLLGARWKHCAVIKYRQVIQTTSCRHAIIQ
jgi:hypothetical protein